jgi:hypothetical protein
LLAVCWCCRYVMFDENLSNGTWTIHQSCVNKAVFLPAVQWFNRQATCLYVDTKKLDQRQKYLVNVAQYIVVILKNAHYIRATVIQKNTSSVEHHCCLGWISPLDTGWFKKCPCKAPGDHIREPCPQDLACLKHPVEHMNFKSFWKSCTNCGKDGRVGSNWLLLIKM